MRGGAGEDMFQFRRGDGDDVIEGFRPGADMISIGRGAERLSDLEISRSGPDTLFAFADVTITLEDLRLHKLSADDFAFREV